MWPGAAGLDTAAKSPTDPAALSYNAGPRHPGSQAKYIKYPDSCSCVPAVLIQRRELHRMTRGVLNFNADVVMNTQYLDTY